MGRAFGLAVGLAITGVLTTVANATWRCPAGGEGRTVAPLARAIGETFVAGPVLELPPAVLRGRGAPRSEHDDGRDGAESVRIASLWREVMADLAAGPEATLVTIPFPEDWFEGRGEPPGDAAVFELLASKRVKDLTWDHANLDEVVAYLRTASGLDVVLTPGVGYVAFDEIEISLDLDDVTLETVLDLVTEPYELRWMVEDGRVKIATKEEASGGIAIRYFDLLDLLPGSDDLLADARVPPPEPPKPVEPSGIDLEGTVLDLIRETTGGAGAWERPAVLEIRNRIVIARSDPQTLERVGAFIEALIAEKKATGNLDTYLETRRWSTVTGAPPRPLTR